MHSNARSVVLLALLILLAACAAGAGPMPGATVPTAPGTSGERVVRTNAGEYRKVEPRDLKAMLAAKDFLLIDVHVPHEGYIAQTDLRIPYDQIDWNLERLPPQKDAKLVVYCMSGRMSQIAAERLVALGYTNVWELDRGMIAWREAGYELRAE